MGGAINVIHIFLKGQSPFNFIMFYVLC